MSETSAPKSKRTKSAKKKKKDAAVVEETTIDLSAGDPPQLPNFDRQDF